MAHARRRGRPPGAVARYSVISEDIARRLAAGEWPVGTTLPSCRQFGKQYAVGAHVINRALRSLQAGGRVVIKPRKLPVSALGARLESVVQNAIAVVLRADIATTFASDAGLDLRTGFERAVSQRGCSPILYLHHPNRWRNEFPIGLRDLHLRGIFLYGPFSLECIKRYEAMNVPVVVLDQPTENCDVSSVAVDNVNAAFDATMRLINLGHRRLAFLRPVIGSLRMIDPDARERQDGFVKACEKAGLSEDEYKIFTTTFSRTSIAVQTLVRESPRITAVVCAGETHAEQTVNAARAMGLDVPRDISVVSFHGVHTRGRHWSGPKIDFERMGRAAAELLDKKSPTPQRIRIPCTWDNGDSVGRWRK